MKKDLHPTVNKVETTCSTCNTKYNFSSSAKNIKVDICASCHPFYTGDKSVAKSTGQVDKFNKKYGIK
ncbi:50S ribosomal protein L31 [Mycoplasmopsis agassizii]|uniref:50S ribosomal protein L31 n=1 Tax=Mycoplasmopsis agassizii TaxID=33922 RepID=A0A1W1WZK8_9BACT|nr:50S ribosomal protein L31 [Mycoplasmopsis agassizii]PAF54940.1 50S ribosomal protein L31 [Mycoplasmopsis agassizii]PAK21745.1 50S ribosomal protein L31 [Mycoplasmopsis agassizii]SMC17057.1 large subunit ribosomal protein L31 [Mycoplasmopsis agassizii]